MAGSEHQVELAQFASAKAGCAAARVTVRRFSKAGSSAFLLHVGLLQCCSSSNLLLIIPTFLSPECTLRICKSCMSEQNSQQYMVVAHDSTFKITNPNSKALPSHEILEA